jgi:galactoside O-acetyltransferase
MKLFSGLSSRCSVYSCTEHYDGSFLTNPTVPSQYIKVEKSPIVFGKHCVVGTNSTVLLGCNLGDYSAVGAFSLVNKDVEFGAMVKGIPAKKYKDRDVHQLMKLEHSLMNATP